MPSPDVQRRAASEEKFVRILAVFAAALAALPSLILRLATDPGNRYLGFQYNVDDHMVYAAWVRQAMDWHFFFDNRFTTDPQPGLTVHLYFFALGLVAKLVGIIMAMTLARIGFSVAFVFLLYRIVRRACPDVYTTKLAMSLAVFGGGIGFLVWQTFGNTISKPVWPPLSRALNGRLPTDVWQPEGYVFPSMLTNGLFMVSLCLIAVVFLAFLSARDRWDWVPHGFVATLLLMNVHSYDLLLVAMVMVGFLVMTAARKQLTAGWLARALVIGAGGVPSAAYFLYVLARDPVFQARAATPTFSANFRQVVFGYLALIVLGLVALWVRNSEPAPAVAKRTAGLAVIFGLVLGLFVYSGQQTGDGYFMTLGLWGGCMLAALIGLALVADDNPAWNLVAAWAVIGLLAPYLPELFQRKLSMGLAIPWAVLSAMAVAGLTRKLDRSTRNLMLVLTIIVVSGTSFRWLRREFQLASANVSNTVMHPVYLSTDTTEIVKILNRESAHRTVVLAMPGIAFPITGQPDSFATPLMPDLNPILSGLTGVYTYAGHWSETPDYNHRRGELTRFFLKGTSLPARQDLLRRSGANYIVAPVPEAFINLPLDDLSPLGDKVWDGGQFQLIRVRM